MEVETKVETEAEAEAAGVELASNYSAIRVNAQVGHNDRGSARIRLRSGIRTWDARPEQLAKVGRELDQARVPRIVNERALAVLPQHAALAAAKASVQG